MPDRNEQMRKAAKTGDRAALERLINDGADIEYTDDNVRRPSAAGLWRPSTRAPEPPSAPLAAAAARCPSRRSPRALGAAAPLPAPLSRRPPPLQCG